ncbi:MAG: hypothetical protein ING70_13795 [Rhodocyclaceae bacterium]|nr:hypothetical protein [Rhodocyclaceae bacterium]MCA3146719.1 hypothetical protein [Rhodocyclaceae bacterium]
MGWIDRNIVDLGRQLQLSYLPPLMVYMAAGISGLTGIAGTFFVKEYLGLTPADLAALGFWAGLPWVLKMPLGHLVDLLWKRKSLLVYTGALLLATSVLIMVGLLTDRAAMEAIMPANRWFVLSALLAPVGYVLQDVVADAMTVEAVPRFDDQGKPLDGAALRLGHTTMQTLGRVAIVGGGILVSIVNVALFADAAALPEAAKLAKYRQIYTLALIIPLVSVLGVVLAGHLHRREARRLRDRGLSAVEVDRELHGHLERPPVNWWILGGGLAFAALSIAIGSSNVRFREEIIFTVSMGIVLFLMLRLVRELDPVARRTLVGTALVIFVFRAMPGPGAGASWWMMDELRFDEPFFSKLSLIGSSLALLGMFLFRRFMAERSIAYTVGFLTIVGTILALPSLAMYHGFHHWTAAHTGGVVDARFIAVIDTALESPLGQVAMIPMLAWIANSAPDRLKATYFAVMASFTNLALSLAQLGTKYLNQIWTVQQKTKDQATGLVKTPADYSQLGDLLLVSLVIGLVVPMLAIAFVRATRFRSA